MSALLGSTAIIRPSSLPGWPEMVDALKERILDLTIPEPNSGCWLFLGGLNSAGYGTVVIGSRSNGTRRAVGLHVLSFELWKGPLAPGHEPDHKCRVRSCANPDHLEALTHGENCRRGTGLPRAWANRRAISHCPQGHAYDEANTYWRKDGARSCRACTRDRMRRRRAQ